MSSTNLRRYPRSPPDLNDGAVSPLSMGQSLSMNVWSALEIMSIVCLQFTNTVWPSMHDLSTVSKEYWPPADIELFSGSVIGKGIHKC